ncbi:MAG: hypothetical protein ACI9FN_000371 [Saprospiraceae bacterium]|jgi:hypothetical protein
MHLQRENTISEHLRDLLDVYPEVNISGIGSFVIIQNAAWIDSTNNELYPPTKTLSIAPESEVGIDFIKEVANRNKNQREIIETLKRAVVKSAKELKGSGLTRIPELGVVKSDEKNQLTLVDVHTKWMEGTAYLPVLSIYPLSTKTGSESPLNGFLNDTIDKKNIVSESSSSSEETWKQSVLPLIVLGLGVLFFLWYLKGCHSDEDQEKQEVIQDSFVNDLIESDTLNLINTKYIAFLTPEILNEGCKIVVGSYGQKNNAESQIDQIKKSGFFVQLVENGDGYRVVIVFDCNDHNLKEYLNKIKNEVTSNAWYLSPNIKTEDL